MIWGAASVSYLTWTRGVSIIDTSLFIGNLFGFVIKLNVCVLLIYYYLLGTVLSIVQSKWDWDHFDMPKSSDCAKYILHPPNHLSPCQKKKRRHFIMCMFVLIFIIHIYFFKSYFHFNLTQFYKNYICLLLKLQSHLYWEKSCYLYITVYWNQK